jgi:transposase
MFYVGLDLGARYTHYCVVDGDGDVVEEGRISSTCEALEQWSERHPGAKVAMETGTQTRWMAALLDERGHEVVVGNARRLRAIFGHERKCDKRDAEMLARLLRSDPSLLSPVRGLLQRDTEALAVVRTRAFLVSQRTNLVNHIRGVARTAGFPLRSCASKRAHLLQGDLPARLQPALGGVFETLATVTEQIDKLDAEIAKLCEVTYTETQVLQSIPGVGPVTALYFVLVIGNPERFLCARDVAAYVGLVPRRSQSGDGDPEKGITKTGDTYLRKLLITAAQSTLGPWGKPGALREWGWRKAEGGRAAKKRAVTAVARKLSVLMLRLWRTGESYEPWPAGAAEQQAQLSQAREALTA